MAAASATSRDRLLAAAKRLFAERGLDGVSLREIIREAGVKHATAVQYHFGDREGLLAAVVAPHEARVDTRREAMLDDYEANANADCRAIAAILVRPLSRELDDQDGRHFLRIYAQKLERTLSLELPEEGSSMWRWRQTADPFLPTGTAEFHPRFAALTHAAVELARRASDKPHADDRLYVSRLIDVVTAIMQAPISDETERLFTERSVRQMQKPSDHAIA